MPAPRSRSLLDLGRGDVPAALLLGEGARDAETASACRRLARALAKTLGCHVEPCLLDQAGEPLVGAIRRAVARGASRLVALPLPLGAAGGATDRVDEAIRRASRRWPFLRFHRGVAPGPEALACVLRERAREAAAPRRSGERIRGALAVVVAGRGSGSPARDAELPTLARLVREAHGLDDVSHAFAGRVAPRVGAAVRRAARLGARRVVVVPCLLFPGAAYRRLARDVAAVASGAVADVALGRPLSPHPALVEALVRCHGDALQDASLLPPDVTALAGRVDPGVLRELRHAHPGGGAARAIEERMAAMLPPRYRGRSTGVSSAPMGGAELARGPDGAVAWSQMWQGFCELALAGGPPHRGTLLEPVPGEEALAAPDRYAEVLSELARGIRMVTGLDVVTDGPPGWIGVVCGSDEMAIWLVRAIVVENVMARREGSVLYLPAGPRFTLGGEIRNVVTVVAKTYHYWTEHAAAAARGAGGAAPPG